MNRYLKVGWNALLTAFVVTLVGGLLLLGLPQSYRATAIVVGSAEDMLLLTSADLLERVAASTAVDTDALLSWQDRWLERKTGPVVLLRQNLSVQRDPETGWISISVDATDAQVAADLANATAETFQARLGELAVTAETKTILSGRVDEADAALLAFLEANPDVKNMALRQGALQNEINSLVQRRQRLLAERDSLSRRLDLIEKGDAQSLTQEAGVQRALVTRDHLRLRWAEFATRYGEQHQKMLSLAAEIETAEARLSQEVSDAAGHLRSQIESIEEQLATLDVQAENLSDRIKRLDGLQTQHLKLQQLRDSALRQYESGSLPERERRYSEALPPDTALGMSQVTVLAIVFLVAFVAVAGLMLARPVHEAENP